MTTIHDLFLALQEDPTDLFVMGALADLCEESGEEDLARHYRTLLLLAQSGTPEEASLIYPQLFLSRTFGSVQQELIASAVDHLRLGDYLRCRSRLGTLDGGELSGEWVAGWGYCLQRTLVTSCITYRPVGRWPGLVPSVEGVGYHWVLAWPEKGWPEPRAEFFPLRHYLRNSYLSVPGCLYSNSFNDSSWMMNWREDGSMLFLVQRGGANT